MRLEGVFLRLGTRIEYPILLLKLTLPYLNRFFALFLKFSCLNLIFILHGNGNYALISFMIMKTHFKCQQQEETNGAYCPFSLIVVFPST